MGCMDFIEKGNLLFNGEGYMPRRKRSHVDRIYLFFQCHLHYFRCVKLKTGIMYLKKTLIIAVCFLVITGCSDFFMICSLHPFYLDKNVMLFPEVEGTWSAKPLIPKSVKEKSDVWLKADTLFEWKIERYISRTTQKTEKGKDTTVVKPMDFYEVKLMSIAPDTLQYTFKMVLFRIRNVLYADFTPRDNIIFSGSRFGRESYFPVHTLSRVKITGKQMDISWLGAEYMKEMIEKKRVRVNYNWVESAKRLLLTGTSEQLTGMIDRYAGEPRFIDWENQLAMLHLNLINR
jgi:hypothetical protein